MPTTPGVPRRSPIQVLTRPDVAYLPRSNGIGSILRGMVVGKSTATFNLQIDRVMVSLTRHYQGIMPVGPPARLARAYAFEGVLAI